MSHIGTGRIRWAALGAAVAVTLGAGIIPIARAVGGGDEGGNTYVPITPCRLMDTRAGSNNVGPRATPLGAGESLVVAVHGTNGQCTIPAKATGIATNTTVLNGTQASFLTLYPADAALPKASNLNWQAGQSATPNQVTVGLSADGRIRAYNDRGTVNVVIDIVGYFTGHDHDDRYYTKAEINQKIAGVPSQLIPVAHGRIDYSVTPPQIGTVGLNSVAWFDDDKTFYLRLSKIYDGSRLSIVVTPEACEDETEPITVFAGNHSIFPNLFSVLEVRFKQASGPLVQCSFNFVIHVAPPPK